MERSHTPPPNELPRTGIPGQRRIRVLFVIGSMGGGGAERQVLEILKRLDRSRFEPFLYLAMKTGALLAEVPADVPIFAYWDDEPESFARRILRRLKLTRLLRHLHLARVLHQQRIDVIYDRTFLATLDAAGGCRFRPTPRISCCVADPQAEHELYARWSRSLSWWNARRAYQNARVVLANSAGLRERVVSYFRLSPEHVQVVPNLLPTIRTNTDRSFKVDQPQGQRLQEFDPRLFPMVSNKDPGTAQAPTSHIDRQIQTMTDTDPLPFLIVCAGRLHPHKGYPYLLAAIKSLVQQGRHVRLAIFGVGESHEELTQLIKAYQLEQVILLAGFVADPRLWYHSVDLFVLSSVCEGLPNALIEAVAYGVPALSTDCPSGPREILDQGRWGELVPPADAPALAGAIARAMDHYQEWKDRAVRAQQHVLTLFEPEAVMHMLEGLLERTGTRAR